MANGSLQSIRNLQSLRLGGNEFLNMLVNCSTEGVGECAGHLEEARELPMA